MFLWLHLLAWRYGGADSDATRFEMVMLGTSVAFYPFLPLLSFLPVLSSVWDLNFEDVSTLGKNYDRNRSSKNNFDCVASHRKKGIEKQLKRFLDEKKFIFMWS